MRLIATAIALAALVLAIPATHAQDAVAPAAPPTITLGVDDGNVLVSTGGEFAQAASGHALAPGHRVLVSEGASATLTYGNGCQKALSSAGVYTVTADCTDPGAGGGAPRNAGAIAAVVGGVAVIAAAAGGGGSSSPPVSR